MTRVLLVEDEPDLASTLTLLLDMKGFDAAHAPNGQAALEALNAGPLPKVIVLDLMMPVMDGAEFRRRQLADPRIAAIPVVILTADARARELDWLRSETVLVKPVPFDSLEAAISKCVNGAGASP